MDQTPWQKNLLTYTQGLALLEEQINMLMGRFSPFHTLFVELFRAVQKFSSTLISISDSVDQEIVSTLSEEEEPLLSHFLNLKSGLIGTIEAWRQVALRSRNQILEPFKTFQDNYRKLCAQGLAHLKVSLASCVEGEQEVIRSRQLYYTCCEKLEKHKEGQAKIMVRIEGGDHAELSKFNRITKNLLEKVSVNQKKYKEQVERVNQETAKTRGLVQKQVAAFRDNEESRVEFLKKVADNQVKILQLSQRADLSGKPEEKPKVEPKNWTSFGKSTSRLQEWAKSSILESYISHDEVVKSKKMKQFQQQNPLLAELFHKVKESEKRSLFQFVAAVLELQPGLKLVSVQRPPREGRLVFPPEWQTFRQKILSLHHYTFYFSHILARHFSDMPNYYVKLTSPFFHHLKGFISNIIKRLDNLNEGAIGQAAASTIYQILKISERVVEKTVGRAKAGVMKVLIQGLGDSSVFKDERMLRKMSNFLVRRGLKKKETKGVMGFTKGLLSTLTGRKQQIVPTEQEQFNALVDLTHLMANLSLSTDVALPFLKQTLKGNEASYQYLKDILISKRDRDQRQKLNLNGQAKSQQLKRNLEGSFSVRAVASISILAQRGFLGLEDLKLRMTCKGLMKIHLDIIYHLKLGLGLKWKIIASPAKKQLPPKENIEVKGEDVEDIIQLDVQRSLQIHSKQLPPEKLKDFLVRYAYQHKIMPYCQGMNYIAGMVMLKTENPAVAYSIYCSTIEKLFLPIFIDNFSGMALKLYLLDRLIAIFHPDLSEHLKREMISPECYSVGWIITAFSSVYQHTEQSYLVDWFWERFVLWGWGEFYRLVLWLIQVHKEQLVGASYDKCLQVLGEIGRCPALLAETKQIFLSAYPRENEVDLDAFSVPEELIGRLSKQFDHE